MLAAFAQLDASLEWAPNIWMGVSVETEKCCSRIDDLRSTGARLKFLSLEPLLGPLPDLNLEGMDWVIVGGESGPKARPMDPAWVTDLREQCCHAGVPFFFKQWGGNNKKKAGRELEGRTWDERSAHPSRRSIRRGGVRTNASSCRMRGSSPVTIAIREDPQPSESAGSPMPQVMWLQYTPWRVSCARCGVKVRAGAVADGSSVFTAAVEELAAYLAQVTDPTTVSRLLGIPPDEHVALSAGSASSCRVPAGRRVRRRRSHGTVGGSRVYKKRPSGAGKTEIPVQKENRTQWRQRQTQRS